MGQAWCKEKSEKAQDSKSPLDRVFVRCAHRIYPGLKEDGSVLGGATQRVTSSEIGYAGSPPRAALLRGQSIDSVDRPFHPSEWVDVNLEVPCTPRASVVSTSANQQRSSNLTKSNGRRSPHQSAPTTAGGAPVPPPRRRRRRERRPLPPKPGSGDDESEPEPHYSRLRSPSSGETSSRRVDRSTDEVEGPSTADSEDEFVAIERILQKSSLEEISSAHLPNLKSTARPKNHSTTSLPNVAKLLVEEEMDDGSVVKDEAAAAARRPPRHVKTASLPRDASLGAPQTPERMFFSRRIEEDNSIRKIDTSSSSVAEEDGTGLTGAASSPDCSLRFETDVKTSTPVKESDSAVRKADDDHEDEAGPSRACQNIDDASRSFLQNASSASRDLSVQPVAEANHEVDRPAAEAPARNNEDAGYESRSSSHLLSNGSSASGQELARDEMSSGILRDATVESCDFEDLGIPGAAANDSAAAAVQRTISEESLPREMLVDEEEEEEEEIEGQESFDVEKSAKDASNELTRQTSANESENFRTPPPSPESKSKASSSDVRASKESSSSNPSCPTKSQQRNPGGSADSTATSAVAAASNGLEAAVESGDNLTSMTPSLMELEAALSDMLERKDEEERRASEESGQQHRLLLVDEEEEEEEKEKEDKSSDKSPEPQIVPVKRNRPLEEVEADLRKVSPQPATKMQQQQAGEEERQPAKSRLIDFHRVDRTNPFNDLKSDEHELLAEFSLSTDEPPEKPSRLHRISLIEESIDEPLIVPTPPRRRHRSKSNLNSPSEATAVAEVFRHATYNDRLI